MGSKFKKILILFGFVLFSIIFIPMNSIETQAATYKKYSSSTSVNKNKTVKTTTTRYKTAYKYVSGSKWTSMTSAEIKKYKSSSSSKYYSWTMSFTSSSVKNYSKKYKVNFGTKKKKNYKKCIKTKTTRYYKNCNGYCYDLKTKKKRPITVSIKEIEIKYTKYSKQAQEDLVADQMREKYKVYEYGTAPSENAYITDVANTKSNRITTSWVRKTLPESMYNFYVEEFGTTFEVDKAANAAKGSAAFYNSSRGVVLGSSTVSASTIFHELGHFMNDIMGSLQTTIPWHELYWKYREKGVYFMGEYGPHRPNEFIADCFSMYCIYPKTLEEQFPEIYDYLDAVVDKMPTVIGDYDNYNSSEVFNQNVAEFGYCSWYEGELCEYCKANIDTLNKLKSTNLLEK